MRKRPSRVVARAIPRGSVGLRDWDVGPRREVSGDDGVLRGVDEDDAAHIEVDAGLDVSDRGASALGEGDGVARLGEVCPKEAFAGFGKVGGGCGAECHDVASLSVAVVTH